MAVARTICKCATCGCEFEYRTKKRNRKEAESFETWATKNINECPDCRQKRKQAERDAANQKAASDAKEAGFPALTGSEKQIAWAESIRMTAYNILCNLKGIVKKSESENFDAFISWCMAHNKSAWWIDHRDDFRGNSVRISANYIRPVIKEWMAEKNA